MPRSSPGGDAVKRSSCRRGCGSQEFGRAQPGSVAVGLGEAGGAQSPRQGVLDVGVAAHQARCTPTAARRLPWVELPRTRGETIGGAAVTDDAMLGMALHLRAQAVSLRNITARLVITKGKKKGRHFSPATVMRMLHDHETSTTTTTA